jgi:hypothetical protein
MTAADILDQGRESFGRQAWADAFAQLSAADREAPLAPEDLERLATAAYLLGRDADSTDIWARAHHEFLARGAVERAARCAFWLAFVLLNKVSWFAVAAGSPGPAGCWTTASTTAWSRAISSGGWRHGPSSRLWCTS